MPWSSLLTGTIFNEDDHGHDVDFKTNDTTGHTLIADHEVNQGNSTTFDRQPDGSGGQHDHYGSGTGNNDNGTDRGYYTGPGSE